MVDIAIKPPSRLSFFILLTKVLQVAQMYSPKCCQALLAKTLEVSSQARCLTCLATCIEHPLPMVCTLSRAHMLLVLGLCFVR